MPLAIADNLGFSLRTVARYLRQLENAGLIDPIPPWLTLTDRSTPRTPQTTTDTRPTRSEPT